MIPITEQEFYEELTRQLTGFTFFRSVSGPGRSGAIASVYASHFAKVPWLPYGIEVPEELRPHLVIDTATQTGATLRKAQRKMRAEYAWALFTEPPRKRFWYETEARSIGVLNPEGCIR